MEILPFVPQLSCNSIPVPLPRIFLLPTHREAARGVISPVVNKAAFQGASGSWPRTEVMGPYAQSLFLGSLEDCPMSPTMPAKPQVHPWT